MSRRIVDPTKKSGATPFDIVKLAAALNAAWPKVGAGPEHSKPTALVFSESGGKLRLTVCQQHLQLQPSECLLLHAAR